MKQYIYHDLDSGPIPAPLSLLHDVPTTSYASDFVVRVCQGHTVAYTGSLRGLQHFLYRPSMYDLLAKFADNKLADFRYRLDVLSDLVSFLNGDFDYLPQ